MCRACKQLRLSELGLCTRVPGELVEMLIQDHFSDILVSGVGPRVQHSLQGPPSYCDTGGPLVTL